MKRLINIGCIFIVILSSCVGRNKKGVVYNPSDRSSYSSEEERELAIAQKQSETHGLLPQKLYENAIKLNIMVPKVDNSYPFAAAQSLTMSMLQITAANGIAGYGGNPAFVFAAILTPIKEGITSSIPKQNYINYSITFYVANIHSGDVFGTLTQDVMGVGTSREQAMVNAMENVKCNSGLSELLEKSSAKIVDWFERHSSSFISEVKHYLRSGDYAKAYGLLVSVPDEAKTCNAFAQQHIDSIHELYLEQMSDSYYREFQNAIAAAKGTYNPDVAAYLSMIPQHAPIREVAVAAYESYVAKVVENGNAEKAHQMYMEEEALAVEKLNAEAEIKAQAALMKQMEMENSDTSESEGDFVGEVKDGVKSMLVDKAYSLIMGGVSSFLSII